jgi:hypothetical protein
MSSTDREPEVSEPPAADSVGGPAAWPPKEAAPPDDASKDASKKEAAPPDDASKTEAKTEAPEPKPVDARVEAASPAPAEDKPKPEAAQASALPAEEMPFSNSTLHWLDDADQGQEEDLSHRITVPGYDPTEPVAGRKRAVMVVGGAAALALVITGVLYLMAPRRPSAPEPAAAEPARELTARAEAALAANKIGEAVDLARLALVADARFADAHFVIGMCDKARNQIPGAREELRSYLELAPLGTHAATAREALAALPP